MLYKNVKIKVIIAILMIYNIQNNNNMVKYNKIYNVKKKKMKNIIKCQMRNVIIMNNVIVKNVIIIYVKVINIWKIV